MEKLSQAEVEERLASHPEWTQQGEDIQRTFKFDDFLASIAFVNRMATHAEQVQHHPDILIRWNKVTLTLSTHDAGGLTEKDFDFASAADSSASTGEPPAPAASATGGADRPAARGRKKG